MHFTDAALRRLAPRDRAYRVFERGYSIQEVQMISLHDSWVTLQRYTHLKPGDLPER